MKFCIVVLMFVAVACLIPASMLAQTAAVTPNDKEISAYIDMMRKDLRKEKQSTVDDAMGLDASQKAQFWTVYADYQVALDKIWDQRIENMKKYAGAFKNMTDQVADQLAVKMMELEAQRTALRNKYYGIYKQKMGARIAARFLQVEVSLASLIDVQLAAEVPLLQ